MTAPDSHDGRADRSSGVHRLTLDLDISTQEPLTGQIGPADGPDRIVFHGWIDLMSAIRALCDGATTTSPS